MRLSKSRLVVSEQVSRYHPDKFADQVSDAIVSAVLNIDENARLAVETLVKSNNIVVAGEITANIEQQELYSIIGTEAIRVAKDLWYYTDETNVSILVTQQSPQIGNAVDGTNNKRTAGDQGLMFGYATNETESKLPLSHEVSNALIYEIEQIADQPLSIFDGDAKVQVGTVDGSITSVVVSTCVRPDYRGTLEDVNTFVKSIVDTVIGRYVKKDENELDTIRYTINPSGLWTSGGPTADSGLTGRKIVADQYGGSVPVGGGAFSGKDLTKVDRSAAYMARRVARELLEDYGSAKEHFVKVTVSYAIGKAEPVDLFIDTNIEKLETELQSKAKSDLYLKVLKRFEVENLITEFQGLDLYTLSKGCHYRNIDQHFII